MKTKKQSQEVSPNKNLNQMGEVEALPDALRGSDENEILKEVLNDVTFDNQPFGEYLMNDKNNVFVQLIKKAISLMKQKFELGWHKESFKKGQKASEKKFDEFLIRLKHETRWFSNRRAIERKIDKLKGEIMENEN